ncbi:hypothetical protein OUZ56_005622 [Daphnia magna]|uniref:Uncharacterized protein n=1 Tax=Daphnia magna TaxID=35525 RepID=A0ABQ9YTD6_9CRUS|nr:hypothetical protein OUZ56_005622 [Daphnia magna]
MTFFGQLVIVPEKISIDTTPSECYYTINNILCGEHDISLTDDKYLFAHEPETVGYWMQSVDWEILNCALEHVQQHQQEEVEGFPTPIGKASTAAAAAIMEKSSAITIEPAAIMEKAPPVIAVETP